MKHAVSFILLWLAAYAGADIYSDLDNALRISDRPYEIQQELRKFGADEVPEEGTLRIKLKEYQTAEIPTKKELEELRGIVAVILVQRGDRPVEVGKVSERAKRIKKGIEYIEPEKRQQANWLDKGMKDFWDWLGSLFRSFFNPPTPSGGPRPMSPPPMPGIGGFFTLIQLLLYGAVLAGLVWLMVYLSKNWGLHRSRKAKGLMEAEEEHLSLDEWLTRASKLAREGDHRGACRCLYLAMLVRLDDADIVRLIRTETNWEHQRRFDSSPRKPSDWSLKSATQSFDVIWYGHRCRGLEDTEFFRERYDSLLLALRRKAA